MPRLLVRLWLHVPLLGLMADMFRVDCSRSGLRSTFHGYLPAFAVMALIQFVIWKLERSRFFVYPPKLKLAMYIGMGVFLLLMDLQSNLVRHKDDVLENFVLGTVMWVSVAPFFLFFRIRKRKAKSS